MTNLSAARHGLSVLSSASSSAAHGGLSARSTSSLFVSSPPVSSQWVSSIIANAYDIAGTALAVAVPSYAAAVFTVMVTRDVVFPDPDSKRSRP
jgi:hypothetical protein